MAKDPAFLFYPNDYIAGVMHLDFECKGAYVDLLMLQFQKGHMTIHMIKHMLGHKFEHIWSHISDKFQEKDGLYWNERLRTEKEIRANYCKSRKDNKNKDKHMIPHMYGHMEDIDINENINRNISKNINVEFEKFWDLYAKKVGDQEKIKKRWESLKDLERTLIMEKLPAYISATPDKQFRKNPYTYLNQKSWNDEIIKSNQNGTNNATSGRSGKSAGLYNLLDSLQNDLASGT